MIAARKIAVPVEETGTISSTAFSRSFFGSGVLCPVTASPLATFKCSRASSCFHDVCASIQSFAAGVPQNSTARVKSVNGVQARTTRPRLSSEASVACAAAPSDTSASYGNRHSSLGFQNRSSTTPATRLETADMMSTSS